MRKYLPLLLLIPFVFAQAEIPWKIEFSRARLIYNVTIPAGYSGYFIYFQIPHSFIDNLIQYYVSKGWNVSNFITNLWPRVYYYNTTTGEQIQIPCRVANTSANEGIPFCLYAHFYTTPYGNVPDELVIYYSNTTILPGSYTYILYYPFLVYWEDWETEYLGHTITSAGQCFNNGWCYYSHENDRHYAKIVSNGLEPTPNKRLEIYAYDDWGDDEWFIIYKEVNVTVNPNYPLIAEWDADIIPSGDTLEASIIFQFRLKDGSIKSIKYRIYGSADYRRSELNICYVLDVGKGHVKRDILKDLTQYCGVLPSDVDKLERIYLQVYVGIAPYYGFWIKMWIDYLKLIIPTP